MAQSWDVRPLCGAHDQDGWRNRGDLWVRCCHYSKHQEPTIRKQGFPNKDVEHVVQTLSLSKGAKERDSWN